MLEWWVILTVGLTILLGLFLSGLPIFVAFLTINVVGILLFFGQAGFGMFANSLFDTTNMAALATIPLFEKEQENEDVQLQKLGMKTTQLSPNNLAVIEKAWSESTWEEAVQCCGETGKKLEALAKKAGLTE